MPELVLILFYLLNVIAHFVATAPKPRFHHHNFVANFGVSAHFTPVINILGARTSLASDIKGGECV